MGCLMNNNIDQISVKNRIDQIALALDVLEISTESRITDIFRYRKWSVEQGICFLVGIFDEHCDEKGICHLTTLGGHVYSEPEDKDVIDGFLERHERLMSFWQHADRPNKKYFRKFFINWASQYQHVCETTWLKDAQNKGFVPKDWPTLLNKPHKNNPDAELGEKEKSTLLKIIAGLIVTTYKTHDRHGLLKEIASDLDCVGFHVSEGTLSKHINAARALLPSKDN